LSEATIFAYSNQTAYIGYNNFDLQGGFVYFGQPILAIHLYTDGDFFLIRDESTNYRIVPYHHTSSTGSYYVSVTSGMEAVSKLIRSAFPNQYANFSASLCLFYTWVLTEPQLNGTNTTLYQVVLSIDNTTNSSFMLVSYAQLDILTDESPFYQEANGLHFHFHGSTTESNCGVPGQFIFQLNKLTSKRFFI
jgi:hypothetical protein